MTIKKKKKTILIKKCHSDEEYCINIFPRKVKKNFKVITTTLKATRMTIKKKKKTILIKKCHSDEEYCINIFPREK